MRNPVEIENIEKMRREQGIDDADLHEDIRRLGVGDFVKLTLLDGPTFFESVLVRITSVEGFTFRGKLAQNPVSARLSKLKLGSHVVFTTAHIHSLPKKAEPS